MADSLVMGSTRTLSRVLVMIAGVVALIFVVLNTVPLGQ